MKNIRLNWAGIFALLIVLALPTPSFALENFSKENAEVWKGDFDEMLERRRIRALVVNNKLQYFLDGARQHGASYEGLELFAKFINEKYDTGTRKFQVIYIPVPRDVIIPLLQEGYADVAAANLTITPERLEEVDFSDPFLKDVKEIFVTGPNAPELTGLESLAGQEVHVRESSSYFSHLSQINAQLESHDLEPMDLVPLDEFIEDSDLLEMVNSGLLPMAVVDNHKAKFWASVFENLTLREDLAITQGGTIGWAFRKDSPQLAEIVNQFVAQNKKGTLLGNTIYNRYLKDNKWVTNAYSKENMDRYTATTEYFQKYGGDYDFDWLMLTALGFQESGLDQDARSNAGAIGVMQMLPSTASDPNVAISDIEEIENNIHAGTKYLRFIRDTYFNNDEIDELNATLFTFASYNAGPNRIRTLRREAAENGYDGNTWFGHVEHVVAQKVGREPVQYVGNIYKYYIAYSLLERKRVARDAAKSELEENLE